MLERLVEERAASASGSAIDNDDRTDELHPSAAPPSQPALQAPAPGTRLGQRYRLEAVIGRGGTSFVYRATDLRSRSAGSSGTSLAIKILEPARRDHEPSIARLKNEYRQTLRLDHPAVPRLFDLDCDQGAWFIAMELLEGETLEAALRRAHGAPLARDLVRNVVVACVAALGHAHERGVVHGDVKPGNIFLQRDGAVRLLDFGAGCSADAAEVPPAATRCYASPEVLSGSPCEPRDDIFSLCCVLYEMLAGQHPFGRRDSIAARKARLRPDRPRGVSDVFWQALQQGLGWSRGARPRSMAALVAFERDTTASAAAAPVAKPPAANAAAARPASTPAARPQAAPATPAAAAASTAGGTPAANPAAPAGATTPTSTAKATVNAAATVAPAPPAPATAPSAATPRAQQPQRAAPATVRAAAPAGTVPQSNPYVRDPTGKVLLFGSLAATFALAAWLQYRSTGAAPQRAPQTPATPLVQPPPAAPPATAVAPMQGAPSVQPAAGREGSGSTAAARELPRVGFASTMLSVPESTRAAALTIRRLDDSTRRLEIRWQIREGSAIAGQDFAAPLAGSVALAVGQRERTLYVPLLDDAVHEEPRSFTVALAASGSATPATGADQAEVTITDDD